MVSFIHFVSFVLASLSLLFTIDAVWAAPQGVSIPEVIKRYGPPEEIVERALLNELEYRYKEGKIVFRNGRSIGEQSEMKRNTEVQTSSPRPGIRAGVAALDPNANTVITTLEDINSELANQSKKGGNPSAGEVANFSDIDSNEEDS